MKTYALSKVVKNKKCFESEAKVLKVKNVFNITLKCRLVKSFINFLDVVNVSINYISSISVGKK